MWTTTGRVFSVLRRSGGTTGKAKSTTRQSQGRRDTSAVSRCCVLHLRRGEVGAGRHPSDHTRFEMPPSQTRPPLTSGSVQKRRVIPKFGPSCTPHCFPTATSTPVIYGSQSSTSEGARRCLLPVVQMWPSGPEPPRRRPRAQIQHKLLLVSPA